MYVRDREGRLQSCNYSYLEAVQARSEEVIGKNLEGSLFADFEQTRQDPRRLPEGDGRRLATDHGPATTDPGPGD